MAPRTSLRALLAGAIIALLGLAPACGDGPAFVPPEVPPGPYSRIVSLTPSVTEMIFALGAGDRLVGVTTRCDYPPEARRLAKVGDFIRPDLEAVVALEPDLIILAPTGNLLRESHDDLVSLGYEVLVVWNNTIEESLQAAVEIGRVLEIGETAAGLDQRLRRGLDAERARLAGAPALRVLWVMGRNPLVAVGAGTFQHELLDRAGCINVAAGLGPWPVLNMELVLASDPDVLIDSSMDAPSEPAGGAADPWSRFASLSAVRAGRVHYLEHDALYRPGPRMVEAQALIGRTLFPDRYAE